MEGPRPPRDTEWPEVMSFLDLNLRPQSKWSIQEEYPSTFCHENSNNMRIIKVDGKVAAHAITKVHITKSAVGLFKVAAIGSVVTDPEFRNQGFGTKVVGECVEISRQQGCDVAVLWTDLFDMYRKMGFELAGTEIAHVIEKPIKIENEEKYLNCKIISSNKIDPDSILKLYNTHTVGSLRNKEDILKNLNIPNSNIYTLWSSENKILAYAVEGKGADLTGYIHEWAGNVSEILYLISHILKSKKTPVTLISSRTSTHLHRSLEKLGAKRNEGFLGMFQLLNPKNVFTKINRYARNLGIQDWIIEESEGVFYIGSSQSLFKTDSIQDIVKLIFGPLRASEIQGFDSNTEKIIEQVLPIPFWIWGWDSI